MAAATATHARTSPVPLPASMSSSLGRSSSSPQSGLPSSSRNQWSKSSSMSPTRGSPTKWRQPAAADQGDPLEALVGAQHLAQRDAELVALPQGHQRWRGAVEHHRHERELPGRVELVVDGEEAVVGLHLVGQRRRSSSAPSARPAMCSPSLGSRRHQMLCSMRSHPADGASYFSASPTASCGSASRKIVGEVLPGQHHDGLRPGGFGLVAYLLQRAEELLRLVLAGPTPGSAACIGACAAQYAVTISAIVASPSAPEATSRPAGAGSRPFGIPCCGPTR